MVRQYLDAVATRGREEKEERGWKEERAHISEIERTSLAFREKKKRSSQRLPARSTWTLRGCVRMGTKGTRYTRCDRVACAQCDVWGE